jgi:xanthine dehydrogenase E subunit
MSYEKIEKRNLKEEREKLKLTFSVNDEEFTITVSPTKRLVDILRDDLSLTGTKVSCGIGRCGACLILMDGNLVNSCLLLSYQVQNAHITTIEGLKKGDLDICQKAFLDEGGFQCGYCTSGMIMATKYLFQENENPTDCEIKEGLSGNLCRCTGYGGIYRAVDSIKRTLDSQPKIES